MGDETGEHDDDRPRGILSPADRRWLRGNTEYSQRSTESRRKSTVRERVRNGLLDFPLLFKALGGNEDLRRGVFDDGEAMTEARIAALALLYIGGVEASDQHADRRFEIDLETAIERAFETVNVPISDANVTISPGRVQLLKQLVDGDLAALPMSQLRRLHLTGWIEFDEYVDAVESKRDNHEES